MGTGTKAKRGAGRKAIGKVSPMHGRQINWVNDQLAAIAKDIRDLIQSERQFAHSEASDIEAFDERMFDVANLPEQAKTMITTMRRLFPEKTSGKAMENAELILDEAIKSAVPINRKRTPEPDLAPGTMLCGVCASKVAEDGVMVVPAPNGTQPVRNRVDVSRLMMMAVKEADPKAQKVAVNSFESDESRITVFSLKKSKGARSFRVNMKVLKWTLEDMSKTGSVIFICGKRGAVEIESSKLLRLMSDVTHTNSKGVTYGNVSIADIDDTTVKIYCNRREIIEGPATKREYLIDFEKVDQVEDAEVIPA